MKYVGLKQVLKAAKENSVTKVYIGEDAEPLILEDLIKTCRKNQIEIVRIKTMAELGKMSGIDIPASAAAE